MMDEMNFSTPFGMIQTSLPVPTTRPKHKMQLPADFVPGKYTVLCGRGKICSSSPGNKHLRSLVNSHLAEYSRAKNKIEKSTIVSAIVNAVRKEAPVGAFVKQERDGAWFEVEDSFAREKIGCIFRDILHTQYRSSTKAKFARRKAQEKHTPNRDIINMMPNPIVSTNSHMSLEGFGGNAIPTNPFSHHRPSVVSISSMANDQQATLDEFDPLPLNQRSALEQMQQRVEDPFTNSSSPCYTNLEQQNMLPMAQTATTTTAMPSCMPFKNGNMPQFRPHPRLDILRDLLPHPLPRSQNKRGRSSTMSLVQSAFDIMNVPSLDNDDFPDDLSDIFED